MYMIEGYVEVLNSHSPPNTIIARDEVIGFSQVSLLNNDTVKVVPSAE